MNGYIWAKAMTCFSRRYLKKVPADFDVDENSRFTPTNLWESPVKSLNLEFLSTFNGQNR